jgi:hypothetical protein
MLSGEEDSKLDAILELGQEEQKAKTGLKCFENVQNVGRKK